MELLGEEDKDITVYKQLSGYYDTLRKSRALDVRNKVAVKK